MEKNINQYFMAYREAVQKIKGAILQSRYRSAANANNEMLTLYYGVGEIYIHQYPNWKMGNRRNRGYIGTAPRRNNGLARLFSFKYEKYANFL